MSDTATSPESTEVPEGIPVTIDGRTIMAEKGELIIAAAERNGVYIPRFCYHPRMSSVGMCRMCIVEVDTGRGPSLQPSCMLECTPDMKVDTRSKVTEKAQDGVLEFLLINHPLDCPVCDKGGECPLQDQTMAYGPGESRFVEEKRHREKPIPVSDLVLLDRERCILCDRCTRFAKEVAGDPLISFINRGNDTEVNTFPDEPFASYFSGNTVQICPVGALTASTYRFRARPWDLEAVESTCQTCSVGCRVSVESSRNQVLRYQGVDVDPVNWGWLCDKGRFGFQGHQSSDRIGEPLVREGGSSAPARWSDALRKVASAVKASQPGRVAVIGGARLTNEAAYAWAKLAKGVIGTDHVDAQLGDGLPAEVVLGLPPATIDEVCAPGATVLLLSPDLKEELPVLFLRLRDAIVNHGAKVVEVSPTASGVTPYATISLHPRPGEAGAAVRALLDGTPPGTDAGGVDPTDLATASRLVAGGPVRVVLGRQSVAESPAGVVDAASALLVRKPDTTFLPALRRGNVRGAIDLGLAPGLLPGRVGLEEGRSWYRDRWRGVPKSVGLDCGGILQAAAAGEVDVLVLLGADPIGDFPDRELAERALRAVGTVVAVDSLPTASTELASVVLPVACFGEVDGSTTNLEGRVSLVRQKVTPPGTARSDWIVAAELAIALGSDLGLESVEAIRAEISQVAPAYRGLAAALAGPGASDGVVLPSAGVANDGPAPLAFTPSAQAAELPAADSYSLRLVATRKLYDEGVLAAHSPALAHLAPGTILRVNPYDFDRLGVTEGSEIGVRSSKADLRIEIARDAGVPRGSAALYFNQPGFAAAALIDATQAVTDIRVETGGSER